MGFRKGGSIRRRRPTRWLKFPAYLEPQPPPTVDRAAPPCDAGDLHKENALEAAGGEASGSNTRLFSLQQSTIRRWVDNDEQKKLDIAWAKVMFRVGIPSNFLNFETNQKLHEVYLQVAKSRHHVKLPSFKHMRTVMSNIVYMRVQKTVEPLTTCWDVSVCTFITDGSSDRRERPVMNFLAAGVDGAVLVATVSMSGRKKTGPALAKLWEQIMREIGLRRINAICIDNTEVNKRAAQILERRMDKEIARILWVPCVAHCCSLLLRDLDKLDWVKHSVKRGHTIVKFIRNHHNIHSLMMTVDSSLSLAAHEEPEGNDGSVLKGPEDEAKKTEEELVQERRLTKTLKGRVPKNLEDKDEELTDDKIWMTSCGRGSADCRRTQVAAKRTTAMTLISSYDQSRPSQTRRTSERGGSDDNAKKSHARQRRSPG
ncbi:hypothetical protein CBR_g17661 [Chara braunii]|uniref:DUF659 domain-containing protein n=1 Tax=Chara braunii TaxID=69332 RepID=A0A388KV58_CHABU|nr:hypothetical protein CBR_g17661 [Chara braunii]|eukprot:GBG73946.1 hypothetical protein CBR_g17661 [Chara braunii]